MRITQKYTLLAYAGLLLLAGCDKSGQDVAAPAAEKYVFSIPANLAASVPTPERNPTTKEGILLGRMLFYDPVLSKNGNVSCATCHQPDKAFTDGKALSTAGVSGKPLLRHVPTLANVAWMQGLFWDDGAKDLESLSFGPLTHPDEMGQNLKELARKLQQHAKYPAMFRKAFGTDSITSAAIGRALAQFQRTLISGNSRYDKYIRNEAGSSLTALELNGLVLFKEHCSSCHTSDFFTDNQYHNNGLDAAYSDANEAMEYGRGRITHAPEDIGKYKTPTLRNIALTAPYMHDGRFTTLEQVLEHYASGVIASATLAPELQKQERLGIPLTQAEKESIIQFLGTLTDEEFVKNPELQPVRE
ncbi:cytochrome c peroxidase [uncultured Pontibacter sp.]|uniref:cytochrome-c peroxidase n=1 Tax=uncultured Pontibacter sp. TaxID=453356 RepID=UPI0026392467|nr:cytochrome c peroxidase [uncultured Pontibacter sp.]